MREACSDQGQLRSLGGFRYSRVMDEQLTALAKEVQELRERQLQDRHEALMRDDAIFRRMSFHDERIDVLGEALKKTIAAVGQCADTITKVGQRIDALVVRMDALVLGMDALVVRMDKTDERWNQLVDQLAREHQNGGKMH
jgi:hypothetical protein